MRWMRVVWMVGLIVSLGCGTPSGGGDSKAEARSSADRQETADGLVKVEIDMPGVLFIRDEHRIGSYDSFLIPPVAVNYKRSGGHLRPELESEVKALIHDSLSEAIHDAGIPVLDQRGQCTMQIGLALFEVEIDRSSGADDLGEMIVVMEFRDSLSGQPLLRYAAPKRIENRAGNRTRQLRRGFDQIVDELDLGAALRAAGLGDDEIRPGCNGLLAKIGREAFASTSAR